MTAPTALVAERALPRGPHRLTREAVLSSQRGRLLGATVEVVAERGYAAATVGEVVSRARVSRKTFYEHFGGKEDCLLAAYDVGVRMMLDRLEAAERAAGDGGWVGKVRAGVRAYLETLAEEPAFARTFLHEIHAVGPAALDRRAEIHLLFAQRLRALHEEARRERPEWPPLPEAVPLALVGGISEVVSDLVRRGRTREIPDLEPTLLFLHLSLFAGPDEAAALARRAS